MKTTVHISSQSISAAVGEEAGGKLKVKGCYRGQIPGGLFDSGLIVDPDQAVAYLGGFFNMHQLSRNNVALVLDGDHISSRVLDVPALPERQLRALLKNEFSQDEPGAEELLYDYAVLQPRGAGGGGRVYAVAAEKSMVQPYTQLFAAVGVKLAGIDLAPLTALRLVRKLPELQGQTFIFAYIEGNEMTLLLFADGQYELSNRSFLREQRNTPAAAVEISRALSQLVQFSYVQATERPLSNVYICGLLDDELQFCPDIASAIALPVGEPPLSRAISSNFLQQYGINYGEFIFCLGGLIG